MRLFIQNLLFLYICTTLVPVQAQQSTFVENGSQLFPQGQLYPHYLASPIRTTFSFQTLFIDKSTIANTGNLRFDLKLGGRLGVYRHSSVERQWQLTLEAGFHGHFDIEHSEDNVGWDGIYGMSFDVRENDKLAWRVGFHHISAHVGDEIMQRTGRTRINYTRQEIRAGLAWSHTPLLQSYVEVGRAYDINNQALQKKLRYQAGMQYENRAPIFYGFGFYSAVDLSSYEESNWDINTTFQVGVVHSSEERRWRFGIEFYDGRSALGEFFQDKERYLGIGLWIDI